MKNSKFKIQNWQFIFCILLFAFCLSAAAQSTNQDFPTPITGSEIAGKIPARDIGDARLTNYFYAFSAAQGDVFINVTAANLNGDIDVFTVGSLRPLTKISLYAGDSATETGRVIYLRKPEKLILRVEGRTPNDNPATFRIKFAGSFVPLEASATAETQEPKLPEIKPDENNNVRVNSVGTIIEIKPKPTPQPKETTAQVEKEIKPDKEVKDVENKENEEGKVEEKSTKVVVAADETPKPSEETPVKKTPARRRTPPASRTSRTKTPADAAKTPPKEPAPNPLAGVRLIVLFKDGASLERPMSEVSRVNVDNKGMLTIVLKDGKIERHSILDVAKMTIE
ncbi:MAG TPA: hypothetical protein VF599_24745 [Pyrinomonadaceae bacterium]|jgi:hypothetical protein